MAIPYPKSKQLANNRSGKKTQRMRGAISPSVRAYVKARSSGVCEVRKRCRGAAAVHMAHLVGRRLIDETTASDLLHSCYACHLWLDTTVEGIRHKKSLRDGA